MFQLTRHSGGPILVPEEKNGWEKEGVFNPGVVKVGDEVVMLYRAVGERESYISRLGLAKSFDGIHFERVSNMPVYGPHADFDRWATEDPRITPIEGAYYVTYVAVPDKILENGHSVERKIPLETSTGLLKTTDFVSYENLGIISPKGSDNKDTVLFPRKIGGRYAMYHRPHRWSKEWFRGAFEQYVDEGIPGTPEQLPDLPSIWYATSDDLINWSGHTVVLEAPKIAGVKVGPGLPPLETSDGWLVIYHQVERGARPGEHVYTARAALFALEDPTICIGMLPYAILTPTEPYEMNDGTHIVFPTGGFIEGDTIYVYYGALDNTIGMATGSMSELLTAFKKSFL